MDNFFRIKYKNVLQFQLFLSNSFLSFELTITISYLCLSPAPCLCLAFKIRYAIWVVEQTHLRNKQKCHETTWKNFSEACNENALKPPPVGTNIVRSILSENGTSTIVTIARIAIASHSKLMCMKRTGVWQGRSGGESELKKNYKCNIIVEHFCELVPNLSAETHCRNGTSHFASKNSHSLDLFLGCSPSLCAFRRGWWWFKINTAEWGKLLHRPN